ncbi:MAG TPA: glycosyltransferase family A protein [Gemmatimonadaceae bacterium]|nr:glycosyltransferase family A protein [Gemmatimonadaceae bacterium]
MTAAGVQDAARREEAPELVSVIIPSYNHREYVETAVRSALAQTHPAVQIIVIDDGSRDGSPAFLEELARREHFEFIAQANAGVCRTLNRAIRERARGRYIALLASDDAWAPEKLALQLERLRQADGAEFCFAQAREFRNDPADASSAPFPACPREGDVLRHVVLRQHVPAGTMLFTRALYDRLGGFDESLREEDWDFVIRAAAATRFAAVARPLLQYRAHATNAMRARSRTAIFHQKALVLAKNFPLVSPTRWLAALLVHFVHDIVLQSALMLFPRYRPVRADR